MNDLKFITFLLSFCFCVLVCGQQKDRILLHVSLDTIAGNLLVEQEFHIYNHSPKIYTEAYLHAWANAYSGRKTKLNKIKLEERDGSLQFSEKSDRGGIRDIYLESMELEGLNFKFEEREFIRISLDKPWKPGELLTFKAYYTVAVPYDKITHYGRTEDGDYLLKYFFLQPATHDEKGNRTLQHYKDFEELTAYPTDYFLQLEVPENFRVFSDLKYDGNIWVGENMEHFRLYLSKNPLKQHSFTDANTGLNIDFGFKIDSTDQVIIDSILPSQLHFLEEHLGKLPSKHLFISSKTRKEQNFVGVDDIDALITKVKVFTDVQRNEFKLIQMLSYEYIDRMFSDNKQQDHWIKNGLQYYLMMKYTDEKFPGIKLVGNLPENFKILGIKPLKFFNASKLQLNDRYMLLYLYLALQNNDQPINTPFDELSKMNQFAISGFKTGVTFYYIDKYLGEDHFYRMIRDYSSNNRSKLIHQIEFRNYLIAHSPKDISWFFDDYIDKKDHINLKLSDFKETPEGLEIKIKNRTGFRGPFRLAGVKKGLTMHEEWITNDEKKMTVIFPGGDYEKLVINSDYLLPEIEARDNYLHTKGLFKNTRRIQFRPYPDVENPEFSTIFVNPRIQWNNYDKFMLGVRFQNQSLLKRPFKWAVSPKYSTGTGSLTGSAMVQKDFYPRKGGFRNFGINGSSTYEHYAKGLSYFKGAVWLNAELKKDPRSTLSRGFIFSYNYLDKEVPLGEVKTNQDKYQLWNLGYAFSKPDYIYETRGGVMLQTTQTFKKIFGEFFLRWRFAPQKQLGVRVFAGAFIDNFSDTDYFNFGVSHVTDYGFNLGLLGRSETSGILSQQYVLADTGMKSEFGFTVNQWVTAINLEIPVFKIFELYADAAVYGNKGEKGKFIYDSGVRLNIIPDFLEFYFPIQSSLGFEPSMENYSQRIRFTLTLEFSKIVSHLRRGWY